MTVHVVVVGAGYEDVKAVIGEQENPTEGAEGGSEGERDVAAVILTGEREAGRELWCAD